MTTRLLVPIAIPITYLFIGLSFATGEQLSDVNQGRVLAIAQPKGNCLACHWIEGTKRPGNIGPPLTNIQLRFPDRTQLRERIWDQTRFNPRTIMPPFGLNKVLSEEEIDMIVEFVWTL